MKDIWTKIAAIVATLFGGLIFTTGALAADASNSNTGADSSNDASVYIQNTTTINSTKNATINNTISVNANTGNNSASQNTGDGSVSSGDITGSVTVQNTGNENGVFNSVFNLNCSGNCNFSASNTHTGAGSTNNSSVNVNNDIDITVSNNADVDNNVGADLNTGGNSADKNTGDSSVRSGDINFSVGIVNDLNKNFIGAPTPGEEPKGPVTPPPATAPGPAPKPGRVLAAAAGLPITGGSLPSWPLLLLAIGFVLKILEKKFAGKVA